MPPSARTTALARVRRAIASGAAPIRARRLPDAVAVLLTPGLGGALARRLLAVAILVPLVGGVVHVAALESGLLGARAGELLVVASCMVVLAWTALRVARRVAAADDARRSVLRDLAAAERSARSVTETASDAIVQADADGCITAVNLAAERLFGRAAAALAGEPLSVLLREAPGTGGAAPIAVGRAVEVLGVRADGAEVPIELSLATFERDGAPRYTAIMRDISARKAAERRAAQDATQLQHALDAQVAIAAAPDLDGITQALVAGACAAVGADGAVVVLPDGDELVHRAVAGSATAGVGARLPVEGSLAGAALRTGAVQRCDDADADGGPDVDACRRTGLRSLLCVPLRHERRSVAVLKVLAAAPHAFGDRERRTLELLAGIAGGAVARAQAEERLSAHRVLTDALSSADEVEDAFVAALRGLARTLGWDAALVWLAHDRAERLECTASWHDPRVSAGRWIDRCRAVPLLRGEGVPGHVWASGEPVWLDDADTGEDDFRTSAAVDAGLRTIAHLPVVSDGAVIGTLVVASTRRQAPDRDRLVLLSSLAAQLGQFAQRARAERRVVEQAADLQASVELAHRLQRVEEPGQVREMLGRAVRTATQADAVLLIERDAAGEFVAAAQVGVALPAGDPLAGELLGALLVADTVLFDDVATGLPFLPAAGELGIRTALLHPLREGAAALLVGWHDVRVERAERVRSLMPLLAAEAGAALERAELVAALRASARTDQLTNLANRGAWEEGLPTELARARRSGEPLSVAMLDLDHFKAYNDRHGHQDGDRLLRESATAWAGRLRSTDLLARYGGEEFAVALPGCSAQAALAVAEGLRASVPFGVTCSIGIATWDGTEAPDAVVARADAALYEAKRSGRDRVVSADVRPGDASPAVTPRAA